MSSTNLSTIIKGLTPGLTERGKIKIGEKGKVVTSARGKEFQPPQKLDYFKVTTLMRGPDGNYYPDLDVIKKHGEKPRSLPVRLLYDDIALNFQCRYTCFQGKTLWCVGDGETGLRINGSGQRDTVSCPCGRQEPTYVPKGEYDPRCKINAVLSVIIDGVERVGGVWKLRTTSYNSTVGILSSLALIQRITGGPLAGIPLTLTLNPKTVITPTDGKSMTVWVVGLEYSGSIDSLQKISYERAQQFALHKVKIEQIEEQARRMLTAGTQIQELADDADDIVDEFYPEQAQTAVKETESRDKPAGRVVITTDDPEGAGDVVDVGGNGASAAAPSDVGGGSAPGNTEQPGELAPPETREPQGSGQPKRRSRRNRFEVEDPANPGVSQEIITCGSTPEQLFKLRELIRSDPRARAIVDGKLREIGYGQLSYLTEEEARDLIGAASAESPQAQQLQADAPSGTSPSADQEAAPDDLVVCEVHGGARLSVSGYCRVACPDRKRYGFCPILGEDPPEGGLL